MVFSLFYVTSWYCFNTFFKAILSYHSFEAVFLPQFYLFWLYRLVFAPSFLSCDF